MPTKRQPAPAPPKGPSSRVQSQVRPAGAAQPSRSHEKVGHKGPLQWIWPSHNKTKAPARTKSAEPMRKKSQKSTNSHVAPLSTCKSVAPVCKEKDMMRVMAMQVDNDNHTFKAMPLVVRGYRMCGHGVFSNVYRCDILPTDDSPALAVALKKTWPEKDIEVARQIVMHMFAGHPNISCITHFFFRTHEGEERKCWQLAFAYMPQTLRDREVELEHDLAKTKDAHLLPHKVRLWMYQLFSALVFMHSRGICHRDIKPENLLLDQTTDHVKLTDLGNAKILDKGGRGKNLPYQVTRYYRAPELCLHSASYGLRVDVWAAGCVLAGLAGGVVLWRGDNNDQQMGLIIGSLGKPTRQQLLGMNPALRDPPPIVQASDKITSLRQQLCRPWHSDELHELLVHVFEYEPSVRWSALDVLRRSRYFKGLDSDKATHTAMRGGHTQNMPPLLAEYQTAPSPELVELREKEVMASCLVMQGKNHVRRSPPTVLLPPLPYSKEAPSKKN